MKRIAVIGSGIAGLTSAYYLGQKHEVHVFEADDHIGGHTHTVAIDYEGERSDIDTGFIVFNERTYPRFIRLLNEIGVDFQPTEMSFSVRNDAIGLEYNGHNINSLFAQRRNIFNPAFLRMLLDIVRFNRCVAQVSADMPGATLGDFLDSRQFGTLFAGNYLLPMTAAIWSMGLDDIRSFPLQFFTKFFKNHGLLNLIDRPQWYTITGGSHSYIKPLTASFSERIRLRCPVRRISTDETGVLIHTDHGDYRFDEAVIACHADDALTLLATPSREQRLVLGAFQFTDNDVVLHTDTRLLPAGKRAWAGWNYRLDPTRTDRPTLTYNMNILQRLDKTHTYLVTLNENVSEEKTLGRFHYTHPVFNESMLKAQQQWHHISGVAHLHYCGAYWFNGFHEDGVRSALRVCEALGVTP